MRRSLLLATLCLPLFLVGAASSRDAFAAGERLSAEAPPVGPFSQLVVSGRAELILVQGTRETVVVEAFPSDGARVRVRSSDGKLSIDAAGGPTTKIPFGETAARVPTITVHFKTLESVSLAGSVKLNAASIEGHALRVNAIGATSFSVAVLKVGALHYVGSGAAKADFAGTATEQHVSIAGAGVFRAPALVSKEANVSVTGAGKVVVNVQEKLHASVSGAGAVEYYGDPQVTKRVTGAGKFRQRSQSA